MDGRISNQRQVASLTRYTVTEGREKGLEIIDCNNGNLRFLLNVGKACKTLDHDAASGFTMSLEGGAWKPRATRHRSLRA